MKITISITKAQASAVLRSEGLSNGHGIRKSIPLKQAEERILNAIQEAWNASLDSAGNDG